MAESWWDTIADWGGKASEWYDRNEKWAAPALKIGAKAGIGYLDQANKDNVQSEYTKYLRQQEEANLVNSQADWDALNAYNQEATGIANANRAAASAAASRNAAASRAAAMQTMANQRKAAKKANKTEQTAYAKALALMQPYVEAGTRILPQKVKAYEGGLNHAYGIQAFLNSPAQQAILAGNSPATTSIAIPLPERLKR